MAGLFVAILERELRDAGFVEVAEAFRNHVVVLVLSSARERQIETEVAREFERDSAVAQLRSRASSNSWR